MSISANIWPLLLLALASFFADPLPTPAPAYALFGEECGCCRVTLCTSPPATLAQKVLTLGAIVDEADRVVSAAEEETVTVGILLPTYHSGMSEMGIPPLKDAFLLCLALTRLTSLPHFGLVGVENDAPSGWESEGYSTWDQHDFKGHPIMGSKLYSMGAPIAG